MLKFGIYFNIPFAQPWLHIPIYFILSRVKELVFNSVSLFFPPTETSLLLNYKWWLESNSFLVCGFISWKELRQIWQNFSFVNFIKWGVKFGKNKFVKNFNGKLHRHKFLNRFLNAHNYGRFISEFRDNLNWCKLCKICKVCENIWKFMQFYPCLKELI